MELRTLSYFLAVAREQNMTEAANVLHVTQPTLSRQIADLEDELCKKLFTRTSRSTVLTADGKHLRQLFAELHSRYPRLTVELFTGNADTVEEKLAHGLIDFALMIEPFNVEQYHFIRLPETMRVGIVTRDDSKWAQKSGITPDDLTAMPLLVSSRQSLNRYDYSQWSGGKVSAETMNIVGKFDLISNASHFIRTGIANAIGIDELLQLDTGHLKFIPLEPALTLSAIVVWKKYRLLSKSSSVFLEELRKHIAEASKTNGKLP